MHPDLAARLATAAPDEMMRGALAYFRAYRVHLADVDFFGLAVEIKVRAPAAIAEALADSADLRQAGEIDLARTAFCHTLRLRGMVAAEALAARETESRAA